LNCDETILAGDAVTPKRVPVSLTTDQTREFDHVDGSQPDLSPILLGPLDGDAQIPRLDGPLMRTARRRRAFTANLAGSTLSPGAEAPN
jgi:hypothetical protein